MKRTFQKRNEEKFEKKTWSELREKKMKRRTKEIFKTKK
jgi:hypothetical protein